MAPPPTLKRSGPAVTRSAAVAGGSALAWIGYASIIERNAYVVREVTMPVLTPGSSPLRVLHISDVHMRPNQRHKQAWLRELVRWEPDLVVNTGDNLAHPRAVPAVVQTFGELLSVPGLFVFGSNDYFGPRLKNPLHYMTNPDHRTHGKPLPWLSIRVADLAVFLEKPAERIPASPPHVVIEIVSPGDRYVEIHDKLAEYRGWGIKYIWLIDPASGTFSVYDTAGLREVPELELPEFDFTIQKSDVFE